MEFLEMCPQEDHGNLINKHDIILPLLRVTCSRQYLEYDKQLPFASQQGDEVDPLGIILLGCQWWPEPVMNYQPCLLHLSWVCCCCHSLLPQHFCSASNHCPCFPLTSRVVPFCLFA